MSPQQEEVGSRPEGGRGAGLGREGGEGPAVGVEGREPDAEELGERVGAVERGVVAEDEGRRGLVGEVGREGRREDEGARRVGRGRTEADDLVDGGRERRAARGSGAGVERPPVGPRGEGRGEGRRAGGGVVVEEDGDVGGALRAARRRAERAQDRGGRERRRVDEEAAEPRGAGGVAWGRAVI